MLRDDGAKAGSAVGGVRTNGDGGGRSDRAELPGTRAAANKGEGHFVVMSRQVNVSQGRLGFRYYGALQIGLLYLLALWFAAAPDLLARWSLNKGGVALAAWPARSGGRP
jgi:hypothetical protein